MSLELEYLRVFYVNFFLNFTVAGSIPPELGNLSALQRLKLGGPLHYILGYGKLSGEAGHDRFLQNEFEVESRSCVGE